MTIIRKIICLTALILSIVSCKAQNSLLKSDATNEIFLSDTEIKYIFHEAMRRLLFEPYPLTGGDGLSSFYSFDSIRCGFQNLEILVSDKTDNKWISHVLEYNKIPAGPILNSKDLFHSMEFYFQPKIYFAPIKDTAFSFAPPTIGYIKFSDIIISENGYYYINSIINHRFSCNKFDEIINWQTSYTYEIERCSSGFLRFKRIIIGDGEMSSSHGAVSTIEILKDTEKCK